MSRASMSIQPADELKMIQTTQAPLVSIIIPALNEEEYLPRTLNGLRAIQNTEYPWIEIIVAVGPSTDATRKIARSLADVVVEVDVGPSIARNAGAEKARGSVFVFLDADALPLPGAITRIANATIPQTVGTCTMQPDVYRIRSSMLSCFKNVVRATMHRGCSELIFCHRDVFFDSNVRFAENMSVGELHRFFADALAQPGAKYKFLWKARYRFSVRRQEKHGYARVMLFWIRWFMFKRNGKLRKQLEAEYWGETREMASTVNRLLSSD
jgi:glycosyltransferase involved in cell wall biosynthesis